MELPVDCLNIIAGKLCYIDLLAFVLTAANHYHNINKIFFNSSYVIERYMNKHDLNYDNYLIRTHGNNIVFGIAQRIQECHSVTFGIAQRIQECHSVTFGIAQRIQECHSVTFGDFIFNVLFDIPIQKIPLEIYNSRSAPDIFNTEILHYSVEENIYKTCDNLTICTGIDQSKTYNNCNSDILQFKAPQNDCYDYYNDSPINLVELDRTSNDGIVYKHSILLHDTSSLFDYLDKNCNFDMIKSFTDGKRFYVKI